MAFKRATKAAALARIALYGPSGSGKTYSALLMAQGLGKKIAVIDSEIAIDGKDGTGAASKYSDRFEFEVEELRDKSVVSYIAAITAAKLAGYDVLIIDSISHAWKNLQTEVEKISKAKFAGNYWAAWSEGNPIQERFLNAIVGFPGHVIATMRARTVWGQSQDKNGRDKPERMGLEPEQGKGIEYEFDLLISINADHFAVVEKDRSGRFQDAVIQKPGQDFGAQIAGWLRHTDAIPGLDPAVGNGGFEVCTADQIKDIRTLLTSPAIKDETRKAIEEKLAGPPFSRGKAANIIEKLNAARMAFKADQAPAAGAEAPKPDAKPKRTTKAAETKPAGQKPAPTPAPTAPVTAAGAKPAETPNPTPAGAATTAKPAGPTSPKSAATGTSTVGSTVAKPAAGATAPPAGAPVAFEPEGAVRDVEKMSESDVLMGFNKLCDDYRVPVKNLDTYAAKSFGPGKCFRDIPLERKRAILADPGPWLCEVAPSTVSAVAEKTLAPKPTRDNPDPTRDGVVDDIPY